nr:hypothetical protein [uncultured Prevotella sp.]
MKYNCIKNSKSPEIVRARMKHGMISYGIYVALMDCLEESDEHKLSKDYEMIAYDMRTDVSVVQSVVEDFGLFKVEDECFYSMELIESIEQARRVSEARAKAGRSGGVAKARNAKQMPSNCQEDSSKCQAIARESLANAKESLANAKENLAIATNSLANAKQLPEKEKRKECLPHTPTKENKKESLVEKVELSLFTSRAQSRRDDFLRSLQPYVSRYGQKLVDDFAAYWTYMNKDDTRMRFEKEPKFSIAGRLATWSKNELRYKGNSVLSVAQKEKQYGIDWEKVLRWYNKLGLVEIRTLTDKRKLAYIAAYEAHGKEGLTVFSSNIKESDYLQGKDGRGPKRDFDYVFNETNFTRIIEGSYRNFKSVNNENNLRKESDAPRYKSKDVYDTGFGSSHRKQGG